VSPVPLDSKESRDPHTVKMSVWLRATSLHSIMIEHKMSDYENVGINGTSLLLIVQFLPANRVFNA